MTHRNLTAESLMEVHRDARPHVWAAVDAAAVAGATASWSAAGLTVRRLRGTKMRTTAALMDEVSAALQFPLTSGATGRR